MSFITTDRDLAYLAARRRQDAVAAQRDASLAYAVGALDAALDAHARATRRVAARRRTVALNTAMMARMSRAG